MRTTSNLTIAALLALSWSCADTPRTDSERERDLEILRQLHDQQQRAHLEQDADLFVAMFNDPLIMVKNGTVRSDGKDLVRQRNQAYFDATDFVAWEDIEPPIVRLSEDGSMAWRVVQKRVHAFSDDDHDGVEEEGETVFAWMEAWEKIDGEWRLMAAASTERPGTAFPPVGSEPGHDVPEEEEGQEGEGE